MRREETRPRSTATHNPGEKSMTLTLPIVGYSACIILGLVFLGLGLSRQPRSKESTSVTMRPGYADGVDDDPLTPLSFSEEGTTLGAPLSGIGAGRTADLVPVAATTAPTMAGAS